MTSYSGRIIPFVAIAILIGGGSAVLAYYTSPWNSIGFLVLGTVILVIFLYLFHYSRAVLSFALIIISGSISLYLYQRTGVVLTKFLDEMVFAVLAVSILLNGVFAKSRFSLNSSCALTVMLVSCWGLISSVVNRVHPDVALLGGILVLKPFLVLFVYQNALIGFRGYGRYVLAQLKVFLQVIPILSLIYTFLFELGIKDNWLPGFSMPERLGLVPSRSFFVHPGVLASVMTVLAMYHFSAFLASRRKASLLLFGVSLIGIILSLRIKSLLFLPFGVCLILATFYFMQKPTLQQALFLLLFLYATLAMLTLMILAFHNELTFYLSPGSSAVRTVLMRTALLINQETLGLGKGLGMYGSSISVSYHYSPLYYEYGIANLYGGSPSNYSYITDQWWAWYLGEIGIVGTLLFLTGMIWVILDLYRIARYWHKRDSSLFSLALASIGMVAYGLISGYADANLTTPPTGYFIMGIPGIIYALHRDLAAKHRT